MLVCAQHNVLLLWQEDAVWEEGEIRIMSRDESCIDMGAKLEEDEAGHGLRERNNASSEASRRYVMVSN